MKILESPYAQDKNNMEVKSKFKAITITFSEITVHFNYVSKR